MYRRIAVDFTRRGLKDLRADALCEAQHIDSAKHAGLRGLHGITLVVNRGCRAGEVVDFIHLYKEGMSNIVPKQLKILVPEQVLNIPTGAREEIVDAEDLAAFIQEAFC